MCINKVLLEHSHVCLVMHCLWLLPATTADLRSCHRDLRIHEACIFTHHWFDRESDTGKSMEVEGTSQVTLMVKKLPANAEVRDVDSVPGLGRFPGGGHGNPLQFSHLENPMDRGACQTTVHRVTKTQTWLSILTPHTHTHTRVQWMRQDDLAS